MSLDDDKISSLDVSKVAQSTKELKYATVLSRRKIKDANARNSTHLLCPRHYWPRGYPAQPRDERAPFHSMTSSATASTGAGILRPSCLAVLRLITSSNL